MTTEERWQLYASEILLKQGYSEDQLSEWDEITKQKIVEAIDNYFLKKNQETFVKGVKILAEYEKITAFLYLQTFNMENTEDALRVIAASKQAEYGLIKSMWDLLGEEKFKKIFTEEVNIE